jgi:hypothetical protein
MRLGGLGLEEDPDLRHQFQGADITDEQMIRALIERWTAAVHDGQLEIVVADHAPDIVMFDVPPPDEGVRGIDAYRETWPPFFAWQASARAPLLPRHIQLDKDINGRNITGNLPRSPGLLVHRPRPRH